MIIDNGILILVILVLCMVNLILYYAKTYRHDPNYVNVVMFMLIFLILLSAILVRALMDYEYL